MRTFGIEEEFQFLMPDTLVPAKVGAEVFRRLSDSLEWHDVTHREFMASQVEHASAVFESLEDARAALVGFRRTIAGYAAELGVVAASVGTSPQAPPFPAVADVERYHRIVRDMAGVIADHQLNGLHVHVGVPDRESGVIALNAARPWIPLLKAMSANSPLWRGQDTGYDSWRAVLLRRWTTSGAPPSFVDADDYQRRVARLIGIGGTADRALVAWDVRLSEHLPTLEFRLGDAQLDAETSLAVAALCRALVTHALEQPSAADAAARASADTPPELLSSAIMHSARFGMRQRVLDPGTRRLAPSADVLATSVRVLAEELNDTGDLEAVTETARRLVLSGTGAEHQRAAFEGAGMAGVQRLFEARFVADQGRNGEPMASNL